MLKLGKFFLNLKILFKEKLIVAISLKKLALLSVAECQVFVQLSKGKLAENLRIETLY